MITLARGVGEGQDFLRRKWKQRGTRVDLVVGSAGTLVLRSGAMGLGFVSTVILSRSLGASGYGIYAWAFAWAILLQLVGSLGLDSLTLREFAAQRATSAWSSMRGLLRFGPLVVLISSLVITLSTAIIGFIFVGAAQRPAFLIAVATVPVLALSTLREGGLNGLGRVIASRVPEDLLRPTLFIVLLLVAWDLLGVRTNSASAMVCQGIAVLIAFIVGWILLARSLPKEISSSASQVEVGRWIRQAIPLMFIRGVATLLSQVDVILIGVLSSSTQVALYAAATRLASVVFIAEFSVNAAFLPVASRMFAVGDIDRLRTGAPLIALGGVLLSAMLAIPLIIFAPLILSLFGEAFSHDVFTVRILCLSFVVSAAWGQSVGLLTMTRNGKQVVVGNSLALAANVALNVALIPAYGARGAAIAWLISTVVSNSVLSYLLKRATGITATPFSLIPLYLKRRRQQ
jgi:O-antigen/teichoic acid export membrane protein